MSDCAIRQPKNLPQRREISVNGVVIPREAVAREAQNHPAKTPVEAWTKAAQALVLRELLLQEARSAGMEAAPLSDEAGRCESDEEALMRAVIERDVKVPDADEASCRRYYEQNRARFRSPDIFEAAHILFAAPQSDAAAFAEAEQRAQAALTLLADKPETFADVARDLSACASAQQGGNLGQITSGQTTPEFEAALFAMAPGTISETPVKSRYGVHIIRLDRRIEGKELPFALVHERIAAFLSERVTRQAMRQYAGILAGRADITGVSFEASASPLVQ